MAGLITPGEAGGPNHNFSGGFLSSAYLDSLCGVCLLHHGQNFLYSTRSGCSFLFFIVL